MRRINLCFVGAGPLILAACSASVEAPTTFNEMAIRTEVEVQLRAEIAAFERKDCDAALGFYADRAPLFVVGGRLMPSRSDLASRCPRMVARIPPGATRPIASETIHVLGVDGAYSVTEFLLPNRDQPGGESLSQFVTKIWSRIDGSWLIVHVHESVARPRP